MPETIHRTARNPDQGEFVKIVRDQDVGEATHKNEARTPKSPVGKRSDPPKIKPCQRAKRISRRATRDWQRPLSQEEG